VFFIVFLFYPCIINFTITILLSLTFIPPMLQYIVLPPNYSFCPFSSTLPPSSPPLFIFSPTCHHTTSPSHPLTSLLYPLNTTPNPAIPDTSTLHYNNRNIPKQTQGPQNPSYLYIFPHPPPPFSTTFINSPKSITSLITTTPSTPTVYVYYHQGVFYIIYKQLVWH
jgi:hypothetical protein